MRNYVTKIFELEWSNLDVALKCAKMMKSTCSIIPRCLYQYDTNTSILGVSDGKTDLCKFNMNPTILWENPKELSAISLMTKYIQQFITTCNSSGIDYSKLDLECHEYIVNGNKEYIGIALYPHNNRDVSIPLLNQTKQCIEMVNDVVYKFNNANIINSGNLTDDKIFRDLVCAKVGMGAQLWTIEVNGKKYPIYLSSNIMKINKSDKVVFELKDQIPNQAYNTFMIRFEIIKGVGSIYTYLNLLDIFNMR